MPNYLVRNIDPEVWKKVKIAAIEQDITVAELFNRALKIAVSHPPRPDYEPPHPADTEDDKNQLF